MRTIPDDIATTLRSDGWRIGATFAFRDVPGAGCLYTVNGSWEVRRGRTVVDSATPLYGLDFSGRMATACQAALSRATDIASGDLVPA